MAKAAKTHCLQPINIGTCSVRIAFPAGYLIVSLAHCVAMCVSVCGNQQAETRRKEIRQSVDEQRCSIYTQPFYIDSRCTGANFSQHADPFPFQHVGEQTQRWRRMNNRRTVLNHLSF